MTNLPAKIELIAPLDRMAPERTIGTLPRWLERSVAAVSDDFRNWTISSSFALTKSERMAVESHVAELEQATRNGPDERIGSALAKLLSAFPSQSASDEIANARAGAYRLALDGLPAWSIERAVTWWLQRQKGEGKENYAFAPSAPQLRRLADLAVQPMKAQLGRMRRLLDARVEHEPTPEERDRNLSRLQSIFGGAA